MEDGLVVNIGVVIDVQVVVNLDAAFSVPSGIYNTASKYNCHVIFSQCFPVPFILSHLSCDNVN